MLATTSVQLVGAGVAGTVDVDDVATDLTGPVGRGGIVGAALRRATVVVGFVAGAFELAASARPLSVK
jgi:hypothetical protein